MKILKKRIEEFGKKVKEGRNFTVAIRGKEFYQWHFVMSKDKGYTHSTKAADSRRCSFNRGRKIVREMASYGYEAVVCLVLFNRFAIKIKETMR